MWNKITNRFNSQKYESLQDNNDGVNLRTFSQDGDLADIQEKRTNERNTHNHKHWIELLQYFSLVTWRTIKKSKVNFCLGFFACFIVVIVVAVLMTILANTPVVFLRLAELQSGEIDLRINALDGTSINYTLFNQVVTEQNSKFDFTSSSPRWIGQMLVHPFKRCGPRIRSEYANSDPREYGDWRYGGLPDDSTTNNECSSKRTCFRMYCPIGRGANVFIIDSKQEKKIGVGREWKLPELKEGEAYLSSDLASDLGVSKGDTVFLRFWPYIFFPAMWKDVYRNATQQADRRKEAIVGIKVMDTYANSKGKYPTRISKGMIMEKDPFLQYLSRQIDQEINANRLEQIRQTNINEFSDQILVNIPPKLRSEYYINDNYDDIQDHIVSFGSTLAYEIGFEKIDMHMPLLPRLYQFRYFAVFLGLIFNVIIIVLLFICIILVYSLLDTNVETRTFEMGVHRMFGMRRFEVIVMLMCQALSYCVFSYPIGLLAAQLIVVFLTSQFSTLIGFKISPLLTAGAMFYSAVLAISIPVASAVLPIFSALGQTLTDALSPQHSKTKAVEISLDRADYGGFSWSTLIVGGAFAGFGVSIYYMMPLALVSLNLKLLLNIFVFLLLGMLFGLALFTLNLQTSGENILAFFLLWWDKRSIRGLVTKNLVAHRLRNRKTAALYAISIAFIVFVLVAYDVNINSLLYSIQQENGAYLKVSTSNAEMGQILQMDVPRIEKFANENQYIEGFSWISHRLNDLPPYRTVIASNIGRAFSDEVSVYAASPNLFDTSIQGFLRIGEYSSKNNNNQEILESLYSAKGSHSTIMGTLYKTNLGLDLESHFLLQLVNETGNTQYKRVNTIGFLNGAPAFTFSQFPAIRQQDCLISFPTFLRMAPPGTLTSVQDIPLKHLLLKLKSGISNSQIDDVKRDLGRAIEAAEVDFWDYRDELEPIETANTIVSYFFNFTTAIAMLVCFFSLNSTMFNSIFSQTKEISILRSMGVQKVWMYRIYIYEALILVLLSSLFGMAIGALVGYTMTIQRALFTQLPIPFVFPTSILATVFVCSIFLSVAASLSPIRHLMKMPIVTLMRYVQ